MNGFFVPRADRMLVHFHPRADLVGTALEGIVEVDEAGRVCGANRAAVRMLWLPREQLHARHVRDLFDRDLGRVLLAAPASLRAGMVTLRTHAGLQVAARLQCAPRPTQITIPAPAEPATSAPSLRELERETIDRTLAAHGGNVSAAARALRVSRNTIYRKRSAADD